MNLVDIIYKSFQKEKAEAKPERKEVTFAPSYLTQCRRAVYYKKTKEPQTNPPDLPALLKMEWGNILHNDIQQRLVNAGILESHEEHRTAEYGGLKFNYFYDGIVNIDGERAILEIKTVYASGYKSIEESPKYEHIMQAISYMIFEGIDKAIILYAGRDNGFMKQHKLQIIREPDEFLAVNNYRTDNLQYWFRHMNTLPDLKEMIESGELPERDFSITLKYDKGVVTESFQKDNKKYSSDWQCSYCSWKDKCWAGEYEQIKKHKFFINGKFI